MTTLIPIKKHPSPAGSKTAGQWRRRQIDAVKAAVKAELAGLTPQKRLTSTLRLINIEMKKGDSPAHLRGFVLIVSAMLQNVQLGLLSRPRIAALSKLALSLLRLQKIKPQRSKLSFLHGELYLALSQNSRADGNQWLSAWELQIARHVVKGEPAVAPPAYHFALGTRMSRLGNLDIALLHFNQALSLGLIGRQREAALLQRIRNSRIAGNLAAAGEFLQKAQQEDLSLPANLDVQWEAACIEVQSSQDFSPIARLLRPRLPHYRGDYLVEGWIWAMCFHSERTAADLPKMSSLARSGRLGAKGDGYFFQLALMMEKLTDAEIPYAMRLGEIGKKVAMINKTLTIDKELLVWGGLTRILTRHGSHSFGILALVRYRALSLQLSAATTKDSLGLLADLYERDWYRGNIESEAEADVALLQPGCLW